MIDEIQLEVPTMPDNVTQQCFGHCCMSEDDRKVAWYCLYFPEYESEWKYKHMCYAILKQDDPTDSPYGCRSENEWKECGANVPDGAPTPPPVPTPDATTTPTAATAIATNFGNETRTRPPTSASLVCACVPCCGLFSHPPRR